MSSPTTNRSNAAKRVAAYRQRMRDAGLVPRTIWVPNLKDPKVLAEIKRQCQAIADAEGERARDESDATALMEGLYAKLDLGPAPDERSPGT